MPQKIHRNAIYNNYVTLDGLIKYFSYWSAILIQQFLAVFRKKGLIEINLLGTTVS